MSTKPETNEMTPTEVLAVLDSEISVCRASLAPLKNPDARWVFEDNLRRLTAARTAVAVLIAEHTALRVVADFRRRDVTKVRAERDALLNLLKAVVDFTGAHGGPYAEARKLIAEVEISDS